MWLFYGSQNIISINVYHKHQDKNKTFNYRLFNDMILMKKIYDGEFAVMLLREELGECILIILSRFYRKGRLKVRKNEEFDESRSK
jgi:hypothetical protein